MSTWCVPPFWPHQVATAKPKPKPSKEKTQKATPKTVKEMAEEHMAEMLKNAGNARGQSIKLSNCPYGKALAKQLLVWAESVETLFKEMQQAIDLKDMGLLQSLFLQAKEKEEEGEKAKACNDHAPYVIMYINWFILSVANFQCKTLCYLQHSYSYHPISTSEFLLMPATPKLSPPGRCSGSVEKACQEEG